jgi:hypothetical protein
MELFSNFLGPTDNISIPQINTILYAPNLKLHPAVDTCRLHTLTVLGCYSSVSISTNTNTENKCTRIAVRLFHWINFNTVLIQFMPHDGTERCAYKNVYPLPLGYET